MADRLTPEERSRNMAKIKSSNTKPELFVRKLLHSRGYRYRIAPGKMEGRPDIWLAKYNTAIFIHGCFWHRHRNCRLAYMPKSQTEFWTKKFRDNRARDQKVNSLLLEQGHRILIIWECTVRKMKQSEETAGSVLDRIEAFLHSSETYLEL